MFENVHGTALRIGIHGILIRGPAQSGKSSLCISLLRRASATSMNACLVADDRVDLDGSSGTIVMKAPPTLAGLIEIAGVGIIHEKFVDNVSLDLIIDLIARKDIVRLPEKALQTANLLGQSIRRIALPSRDAAFSADVVLSVLADDKFRV